MKNGVFYGTGNILGYDRKGKEMVITEEQAKTVRMIYDMLGRHRHLLFYLLLCIGICLNMGAVYKHCLRGQVSCFRYFFQYPAKDLVHRILCKPMTEVITHRGKMRRFLLQRISQEPALSYIQANFICRPPQGWQPVQMLD